MLGYFSRDTVCTSCLQHLSRRSRRHAATAAVLAEEPEVIHEESGVPPVTQTRPQKAYRLLASPVLSRPPLLTRELTSFEKAFYLYQKRLNERLALPFMRYFYYKKDTPADIERKRKEKARRTAAKDIGIYSGYGPEAWNDEVLVGDGTAEPTNQVEALIRDAEGKTVVDGKPVGASEAGGQEISGSEREGEGVRKKVGQEVAVERPMPRITDADRVNDFKSLSRKLDRCLYLLVKNKDGKWRFPEDRVYGRENLQQVCGISAAWIELQQEQLTNHIYVGSRAHPRPISRRQHEYLVRRQPSHWPLRFGVPVPATCEDPTESTRLHFH